ncbi:MAG: hypothetical protein IJD16_04755 [Desulfovibrio sp.]|nr:hypothetical protein [Desulfovibrio sp.]
MTSRRLLEELVAFVREAVADYAFPAPDGESRDVQVFLHGLPEGEEDTTYPFVLVRWVEGHINSEPDHKTVLHDTVALVLGVYSPTSQEEAGLLTAELLDCLRRALWKQRLLARMFELEEPLRCAIPQPGQRWHEYHMATIETVWNYVWPPKGLAECM